MFLWRRTESDCLALVGHAGASRQEAVHWQWVPRRTAVPCTGRWRRRTRLAAHGHPGRQAPMPGAAADGARALLPVLAQGQVAGLLLAAWDGPDPLAERCAGP
ncbi:hypothetical protein O1L60_03005 [Streptomyces diastatochromogenes]|nr:hypothetical protein [Streptomyces diastatochromogenes]